MTKFEDAENANSSDSRTASSSLSEAVQSTTTLKDIHSIIGVMKPADVCIIDKDGYIACGPIVGSPRSEKPGIGAFILPENPLDPQTGKFPPKYEPLFPTEPFTQIKPWSGKPYELPLDNGK
ncbi:hypothetical protein KBI23_19265 [bacterium]|nr:hypothetical protein [bacterium]MBP9810878.1 hypothetical protein [bacterium]